MAATEPAGPRLRVVRGLPDDAELAAVITALLAVSAASAPVRPEPARSAWAAPAARWDAQPVGPDSWRLSGLPR
ncbi:acyl-CoA carboxylase epsilon subunit [Amycolatopsis sp. Hca4]|uniref:acyl-CoA carboxylase epsilon subunit n=1 Tax=unclassified Amycolatopsis TaxID=2618356 RepID=UPI000CA25DBB|nr:acyl-CoA carboxylase epsilon subunit [Amycolatopsis sp. Hca4]ATV95633.1 acetyl-CoA carboxylase [Amycolatopsis sp.]QKV75121.1 acyl-CoA carboxylase subunit epsilon [Amycolatopsis sp. Hca4]